MDVDTEEDVLRTLGEGKTMDYEQWPDMFPRILSRLEKIVKEEFPPPTISAPSSQPIPSSPPATSSQESTQPTSSTTNKENDPPTTTTLPPEIQDLLKSITSTLSLLFTKNPPHTIQRLSELLLYPKQHYRTLVSYLHALDRVVHVTSGANVFPLPPAVPDPSSLSVLSNGTSTITAAPSISWGTPASAPATSTGLGSDESLGGALLTPITWLNKPSAHNNGTHSPLEGEVKTESTTLIEGPNGPGGIETVSVSVNGISSTVDSELASLRAEGGITQGELLRQEQRAGVVPVVQLQHTIAGGRGDSDGRGEDDEMPHARGPDEMTMEDMGPQREGSGIVGGGPGMGMQGIDIEAAVGRKLTSNPKPESSTRAEGEGEHEVEGEKMEEEEKKEIVSGSSTPKREADEELAGGGKRLKSEEPEATKEEDQEMETVDADGNLPSEVKEEKEKKEESEESSV